MKMTQSPNNMKTIFFLGNNIPSYLLGVKLPIEKNKFNLKFQPLFLTKKQFNYFTFKKNIFINLLWVVRRCDPATIILVNLMQKSGFPIVYEFDDRFDLLPIDDLFHTSTGVVASFYWMISKSKIVKTYSPDAIRLLPKNYKNKISLGRQYTPVFVKKKSIANRWNSNVIKVGILNNVSNEKLIDKYNQVTLNLKEKYGSKIEIYSFSKFVFADCYLEPEPNILKYWKKIAKENFHFVLNFPVNSTEATGKTPNKFREAGGFGYICATSEAPEFQGLPNEVFIQEKTVAKLSERIIDCIENPKKAIVIAEGAYEYCKENYGVEAVIEEISSMALKNSSSFQQLFLAPFYDLNLINGIQVSSDNVGSETFINIVQIFKYFGINEIPHNQVRPDLIVGPSNEPHQVASKFYLAVSSSEKKISLNLQRNVNHLGKGWQSVLEVTADNRYDVLVAIVDVCLYFKKIDNRKLMLLINRSMGFLKKLMVF